MRYILILIFSISIFTSCTYERKLKKAHKKIVRLTERFPSLIKIDTTIIPGVHIDSFIVIDTNFNFIDSTVLSFREEVKIRFRYEIPDYLINNLIESLRDSSRNRRLLTDTIINVINGDTLRIWQEGDKIRYSFNKEPEIIINTNIVVKKPTFWQDYGWIFWILLVIAALFGIKKLVDRFLGEDKPST